ncbi:PadR family transcriptional regulator [Halegenticoccus soli]|uniref:PadR family transcriptional regulator n=1 Tax=Halegenticoccus soli TaxID=1985678 RepID=UPI000C6D528B|nr:PadR family transcriptional regulator [Halegenticoccus soli]
MSLFELSGFQRDLLYVIAGKENPSGQDVKEELERHLGGGINHGRLYPNLDTLVKQGYVEKGTIDRRTNSYSISEKGLEELEEHREWKRQYFPMEEASEA